MIFKQEFNKPLDNYINIISKYDNLIFIETNNEYKCEFGKYYSKSKFNQEVNNLPQNLNHLTFGDIFNKKVNNLPSNITHLTFDWEFNKEVINLSSNITHLTFGENFNQSVNNLPQNINYLTFGDYFNQ